MKDSFYTPTELAKRLVGFVKKRKIYKVADFCVGDGELLRAAEAKWKNAEFIATDISVKALSSVINKHPNWVVGKCDFQSNKSRSNCKAIYSRHNKIDLVLLNPPFSCVGGTRYKVLLDGKCFTASTAMCFVVEALKYLSPNGCIYAILPSSVAYSDKDKSLWNFLVERYMLKVLEESSDNYFKGCTPNIILASLNSNAHRCISVRPQILSTNIRGISVCRGNISMNTIKDFCEGLSPLIHSTNLQNYKVTFNGTRLYAKKYEIEGPALLFPRVGNPRKDKLCILPKKQTVVLSDCVIAIKTNTQTDAKEIQKALLAKWESFSELYQGTGARYITLARVKKMLGIDG